MAKQNDFPTVEELSVGFSEFKLEPAVDLIEYHERPRSVTTVIDCNRGIATSLWAQLPTTEEADVSMLARGKNDMSMTSVTGEYHHAAVGAPFTAETEKHEFTEERRDALIRQALRVRLV